MVYTVHVTEFKFCAKDTMILLFYIYLLHSLFCANKRLWWCLHG